MGFPHKEIRSPTRKSLFQRWIFVGLNFSHMFLAPDPILDDFFIESDQFHTIHIESLWRFLALDTLTSDPFIKLVHIMICAKMYMNWKFSLCLRFFCTTLLLVLLKRNYKKYLEAKRKKMREQAKTQNQEQDLMARKLKSQASLAGGTKGNFTFTKQPNDDKNKQKEFLARILDIIPEGVVALDHDGNVKYMNNYMKNIFEFEDEISLKQINEALSNFVFKEASLQVNNSIISKKWMRFPSENYISPEIFDHSVNKLSREEFLHKVQRITSLQALFTSCMKEPETQEATLRYVPTFQTRYHHQSDNEWYSMEVKAQLFSYNFQEKYLIILWRDTTERENKILSLEQEKVNFRNNILASFSHELRTPLNANLAFLEQSLDSPGVPYKIKEELLKPALVSGKMLFFMIKDILDYSQMVLNRLDLHIKPRNIAQTINQCLELFQDKITQKGLQLGLLIDPKVPSVVFTDHERFSQILINLLSNAVKFTTHGSIDISVEMTKEATLLVSVKDTGVGMDKKAQDNLKNKLLGKTITDRISQDSVGIGVGSYISNKLARKLSARESVGLEFVSKEGKGSYFYFEIENKKPRGGEIALGISMLGGFFQQLDIEERCDALKYIQEHQTHSIKNVFQLNKPICQRRALVVDDEIFNIIVIENFCRSFGICVEKAFHGEEALMKLKGQTAEKPIKVVFMDINMPVMDGYHASLKIKEMIEKKEIEEDLVIVGVTAYVSGDVIDKCYKSGMKEVLNKPVSKEALMHVLKKYEILD